MKNALSSANKRKGIIVIVLNLAVLAIFISKLPVENVSDYAGLVIGVLGIFIGASIFTNTADR